MVSVVPGVMDAPVGWVSSAVRPGAKGKRISFSADSFASEPELEKITWLSRAGASFARRAASRIVGSVVVLKNEG